MKYMNYINKPSRNKWDFNSVNAIFSCYKIFSIRHLFMISLSVNIQSLLSSESHFTLVTLIIKEIREMLWFHMVSHICYWFVRKLVANTTVGTIGISFNVFVEIFRSSYVSWKYTGSKQTEENLEPSQHLVWIIIGVNHWFGMDILHMSWESLIGSHNITAQVTVVSERIREVLALYVVPNISFPPLSIHLADVAIITRCFWLFIHVLIKIFDIANLTCKKSKIIRKLKRLGTRTYISTFNIQFNTSFCDQG